MSEVLLRALDGANPLGFMAAVGALRLCDLHWKERAVGMRWVRQDGWRPLLCNVPLLGERELCDSLCAAPIWAPLGEFAGLGNNLTVPAETFRSVATQVARDPSPGKRAALDFVAAFGNEAFDDKEKNRIQYTDLSFIAGSGHQHFLGTARALRDGAGPDRIEEALFGPWRFGDKGSSFRWDPDDAKEYALRWRDPSVGGVSSVWGANRLAFEALPFFPTIPTRTGLRTTGFSTEAGAHEITWPIWTHTVTADTVRSLLGARELNGRGVKRSRLSAMGIEEVFRAQRVRIGQGANFKVSFRPSRAV